LLPPWRVFPLRERWLIFQVMLTLSRRLSSPRGISAPPHVFFFYLSFSLPLGPEQAKASIPPQPPPFGWARSLFTILNALPDNQVAWTAMSRGLFVNWIRSAALLLFSYERLIGSTNQAQYSLARIPFLEASTNIPSRSPLSFLLESYKPFSSPQQLQL